MIYHFKSKWNVICRIIDYWFFIPGHQILMLWVQNQYLMTWHEDSVIMHPSAQSLFAPLPLNPTNNAPTIQRSRIKLQWPLLLKNVNTYHRPTIKLRPGQRLQKQFPTFSYCLLLIVSLLQHTQKSRLLNKWSVLYFNFVSDKFQNCKQKYESEPWLNEQNDNLLSEYHRCWIQPTCTQNL